jgi:hypothetical protein
MPFRREVESFDVFAPSGEWSKGALPGGAESSAIERQPVTPGIVPSHQMRFTLSRILAMLTRPRGNRGAGQGAGKGKGRRRGEGS